MVCSPRVQNGKDKQLYFPSKMRVGVREWNTLILFLILEEILFFTTEEKKMFAVGLLYMAFIMLR